MSAFVLCVSIKVSV